MSSGMSQTPLTDRPALLRQRARARRAPALFLHEIAADEIEDRLAVVNKSFTTPAIVTGFPDFWQARHPAATVTGDADTLALRPGAHDLVIHALCLHWANDPVGQLVQARRALCPDGLLLAVLYGGDSLHELRAALAQAEADVTGGLSPRVLPMGEIRDLGALLQRAGFALPVADRLPLDLCYPDALALMRDLRRMGEGNAMTARPRNALRRAVLARACDIYAREFAHPQGGIRASAEMIFLTGWAPDDSQPKPLRPGSAAARLSDALGTRENPLED
ncbi:SAM-dependent methyltransferase [Roseovarius sp. MBR-78]|jgi:SAM-dependent methyltransferase